MKLDLGLLRSATYCIEDCSCTYGAAISGSLMSAQTTAHRALQSTSLDSSSALLYDRDPSRGTIHATQTVELGAA